MKRDQKHEQRDKRPDTSRSVHLSASAGSGKTRALKERYLALLEKLDRSGMGLDQAVAITFTDKAAAEIRERVLRDLSESMLRKIIRGGQDLRISTIHSFCMNLLKRYPLEAGLPPDFGVLDERDRTARLLRAADGALEQWGREPELMAPLAEFTADDLAKLIVFLLSIRSRLKRMELDLGGPGKFLAALRRGMETDRAEAALGTLLGGNEWRSLLRRMEKHLRSQGEYYASSRGREHALLSDATDIAAASRIADSLRPVYFTAEGSPRKSPFIAKSVYTGKDREEYETTWSALQELLVRFRDLHTRVRAGHEAMSIASLYLRAEEEYQLAKLREGLLDFDDLEIYAYGLLRRTESADILYWLDRKVLHFLVDEFQDTSDIQWAVVSKLTEELFSGQGADKPMPPTLFVVGDEKQSIYRFREANYRLIGDVRLKMEQNLPEGSREIRTLDRNYRSTPAVVESVNRIFSALWGSAYQPGVAERRGHDGSVRLIELASGDAGHDGPSEAAVLAREIKRTIETGATIWERPPDASSRGRDGEWKTRRAGYGDCAVLIQSRTRLREYEAALQKENVPYRVLGGIGFYEEDEIQAVMHVLFFLWNRHDRMSLAACLRSPLFGLTEADVLDIFTAEEGMMTALRERMPGIHDLFHEWGRTAGVAPLAGLIHRIVNDTGAFVRFGKRNPQAMFNLDKLLDTAREFDRRGYTTLQDFVAWVKSVRETDQREAAADVNLPDYEGVVSIMTVHKAKGLEFSVVFLPGLNQQPRAAVIGPDVIIENDGGVRMGVKNGANPVYDELWAREQEELVGEHQRLLYVAMTRARDHLVMLGTLGVGAKPLKKDSWLDFLHRNIPMAERAAPGMMLRSGHPGWQAHAAKEERAEETPRGRKRSEPQRAIDPGAVLAQLRPLPRSETPERKKATDFIHQEREDSFELRFMESAERSISPLTRGSVLHRCLEEFAKQGAYELDRVLDGFPEIAAAGEAARGALRADVDQVLRSVVAEERLAWIFARGNAYAELPFLYRRGNAIVSGVVDRLIVRGDKGFVIDYKAIRIENDESLSVWKDHYLPQIRVYCEAIKELFKLSSVEGYLLFLDSARLELTVSV